MLGVRKWSARNTSLGAPLAYGGGLQMVKVYPMGYWNCHEAD